jgi:putative transposase
MNTVKIYQLNHLPTKQYQRFRVAQQEAALVWNACVALHVEARMQHTM